jgi:hypothetical protein
VTNLNPQTTLTLARREYKQEKVYSDNQVHIYTQAAQLDRTYEHHVKPKREALTTDDGGWNHQSSG